MCSSSGLRTPRDLHIFWIISLINWNSDCSMSRNVFLDKRPMFPMCDLDECLCPSVLLICVHEGLCLFFSKLNLLRRYLMFVYVSMCFCQFMCKDVCVLVCAFVVGFCVSSYERVLLTKSQFRDVFQIDSCTHVFVMRLQRMSRFMNATNLELWRMKRWVSDKRCRGHCSRMMKRYRVTWFLRCRFRHSDPSCLWEGVLINVGRGNLDFRFTRTYVVHFWNRSMCWSKRRLYPRIAQSYRQLVASSVDYEVRMIVFSDFSDSDVYILEHPLRGSLYTGTT